MGIWHGDICTSSFSATCSGDTIISIFQELLSWKLPFGVSKDILVALAIIRGELPRRPEEPELENLPFFNKLWELAICCWVEKEGRPSSLSIVAYLDGESRC